MGGGDEPYNISNLLPREHYIAHLLLSKIHNKMKLKYAVFLMSHKTMYTRSTSRQITDDYRKILSYHVKNSYAIKKGFESFEHKCEILFKLYMSGYSTSDLSEKYKIAVNNVAQSCNWYAIDNKLEHGLKKERERRKRLQAGQLKNNLTDEQEKKRIEGIRRADRTVSAKKLSELRKGTGNPAYGKNWNHKSVVCPHCNKIGGGGSMMRWHFDNCKLKVNVNEN